MKKLKLTEAQIIEMLKEAGRGLTVDNICRKYGVASNTYYKLRTKYSCLSTS